MELELRIPNQPGLLGLVKAFAREVVRLSPLPGVRDFEMLICGAAEYLIRHAYLPGETGDIILKARQHTDHLSVSFRDFGPPRDIRQLQSGVHEPDSWLGRLPGFKEADSVQWTGFGPGGKRLTLTKSFHGKHISSSAADLAPFQHEPPLAPEQDYGIRKMRPRDAEAISRLIYKAYGPTYFNRDVYYPERVAALNARGTITSFVAEDAQGEIVGHYALERNQPGPVAEGGQAVVDPAHRGRHLLDCLKRAAVDQARELGLTGFYSDAVTVHRFTQKANLAFGARLCCADLGISPRTEKFVGIEAPASTQRISCLLYFLPLQPLEPRKVFAAEAHREMLGRIYENLGVKVDFGEDVGKSGGAELQVDLHAAAGVAFLTAPEPGSETVVAIRQAVRQLVERRHAAAVFVQFPIQNPGAAALMTRLGEHGFGLAGVAPCFAATGDWVRMLYLAEPLSPEGMEIEEPFARELVRYVLHTMGRD